MKWRKGRPRVSGIVPTGSFLAVAAALALALALIPCLPAAAPAAAEAKTNPARAGKSAGEAEEGGAIMLKLPPPPEHPDFYPNRGLYDLEAKSNLPYIRGEQIGVQWADCEPQEGKYDFTSIANALEAAARRQRVVVIRVNGNRKPAYLYAKVPMHPKKWSVQIYDEQGTLMFWHDSFQRAYLKFLSAYAAYLKQSPHQALITGLRLNYDAIGTEHYAVPDQYRPLSQWICPPGVAQGPEYSEALKDRFKEAVVDAAFRFAAMYAGYHAHPGTSPGMWVALRGKGVFPSGRNSPKIKARTCCPGRIVSKSRKLP